MINPRRPTPEELEYIAYLAELVPGSAVENLGLTFFYQEPLDFAKGFANWKVMKEAHALDVKAQEPTFTEIEENG